MLRQIFRLFFYRLSGYIVEFMVKILFFIACCISIASNANSQKNITKEFLTGKNDFKKDVNFVQLGEPYANKSIYLNKEASIQFKKMYTAALADNIKLLILSAARNFDYQKTIWDRKWEALNKNPKFKDPLLRATEILKYSALPGTSRHHWGTDIDLVNLNNSYFESGEGKRIYEWLKANASKYGFYQPYTAGRKMGYKEEKWHWSYLPLAEVYLQEYLQTITCHDISGFYGANTVLQLNVISNYVKTVNTKYW